MPLISNPKKMIIQDIINDLEQLPKALVERASHLDVITKKIQIPYSSVFDTMNYKCFDYEDGGFRYYDFRGWRIAMEIDD